MASINLFSANPNAVAEALANSVSLLFRRLREPVAPGELTLPERSALSKIGRRGPMTGAALAKLERISPQSTGATLAALESRGLVSRAKDPWDGRRVNLSVTDAGRAALSAKRESRNTVLAQALEENLTPQELGQLMLAVTLLERLAQAG